MNESDINKAIQSILKLEMRLKTFYELLQSENFKRIVTIENQCLSLKNDITNIKYKASTNFIEKHALITSPAAIENLTDEQSEL